jgi:1-acyl-sn-glycerol-3-phosphate acyltransferase
VLRAVLVALFYISFGLLDAAIGLPWTILTGRVDFLYRFAMWIVRTGLRLGGIRTRVSGRDGLDPKRSYIFMSNHISNLDPPVLAPLIPGRTSVLAKSSIFRIPFLGYAMRLADMVPIDRGNRESSIASIIKAEEVLRSGLHMLVYPEGTRSRTGRLQPFKKGPFYMAAQTKVPIVPVTIYGTEKMLKKGAFALIPGDANVVFHAPVFPDAYPDRESLMAAVHSAIASVLPEELKPEAPVIQPSA